MYNDLPSINVLHGESLGPLEGQSPVHTRHQYLERYRDLDVLPVWDSGSTQQAPDMHEVARKTLSKMSTWLPLTTRSVLTSSSRTTFPGNIETPAWTLRSTSLTRTNGITEDSLGSDQTSSGGSWSPEDSEGYPRYDITEEEPFLGLENRTEISNPWPCQASTKSYVYPSPVLTGSGKESVLGVALQDVQQYPDHCATDSGDELMSITDSVNHDMLAQCTSRLRTTLPCTTLQHSGDKYLFIGRNKDSKNNRPFCDVENDDGSEYQDQLEKTGKRCKTKKVRPARTIKKCEGVKSFSNRRGSKYSSKKSPKHTPNTTAMRDRSLGSRCHDCEFQTTSKSILRKHALTVHVRPFTCSFRIYGCPATFGSKNEWKRHVSSQHLRLGFWRCDLDGCLPSSTANGKHSNLEDDLPSACSEEAVTYNEFNRKDLFTQHLRRMHAPGRGASKADREAFNDLLGEICTRCWINIRNPPRFRACGFCDNGDAPDGDDFCNIVTWEARMEHVGRHLEMGHGKSRTWREDSVLRDWMIENGLVEQGKNGVWILSSLQRGKGRVIRNAS